jgi:hypothetical protein
MKYLGNVMRSGEFSAWMYAAFCTFIWLMIAFLVAFPEHIVRLEFVELRQEFFGVHGMERLFLPILVAVDIAIDWVLGHRRLSERAGLACILCLLTYAIFAGVVPFYQTINSYMTLLWLFTLIYICLAIPRFFSFLQTPTFRSIK